MSDLLTDDDLRTERGPVKEPAKRWRNWYVALKHITKRTGERYEPGEVYPSPCAWPSKDIAVTKATIDQRPDSSHALGDAEYLGAFPEGERP